MLDHLSIQCADVAAGAAFYDAVLALLGGRRVMDFGELIGFGVPLRPKFWIGPRATGEGFRDRHIGSVAPDRAVVRAFFQAAVSVDAEVLHEPRVWPEYHPGYYGAFVRDPDGNNVDAVAALPDRDCRRACRHLPLLTTVRLLQVRVEPERGWLLRRR
jgi:catechol 2,3-dioxygenase-like lactoylglutathione lyase family enzyme